MKKNFIALSFVAFIFTVLTISCSKQQAGEPGIPKNEDQTELDAYEDLFRSIDVGSPSISNYGSDIELLPYSASLSSTRSWDSFCDWVKKHAKTIVTVASDALGGALGSVAGPAGTVGGAVLASGVTGAALGGEVTGTPDKGGNTITITLPTTSTLESKTGNQVTVGEAHNKTLKKFSSKGLFTSKDNSDVIYAKLRKEIAEDYKIELSSIPEKNPVKFTPMELLNCIESPEVNSFDEMVKRFSEVSDVSEERSRYILVTVINNLMLLEKDGDIEAYNIDLCKFIQQSKLLEKEKCLFADGTSIVANSNLYWNEKK